MTAEQACPWLSIITVNKNNAEGLCLTLNSISAQNLGGVELIVVDGGSKDESLQVIRTHELIVNTLICGADRGIAHAFNKGTRAATGVFVNYLNSGDRYIDKDSLQMVRRLLRNSADCHWAYGLRKRIDQMGRVYTGRPTELLPYTRHDLVKGKLSINHQAAFFRRDSVIEVGCYDEKFQFQAMDYDLMLRLSRLGDPIQLSEYMVIYDDNGISARYHYACLLAKHRARCLREEYSRIRAFLDLLRTHWLALNGKLRRMLRPVFLTTSYGRRLFGVDEPTAPF